MKESNKLIAEFMGCTHPFNDLTDATLYSVSHGTFEVDELRYHESWDWLMPVVQKIEEIAIDDTNLTIKEHRYHFDMGYTQCYIYDHIKDCVVASGDMGSKLPSTYKAVVEFIKENNQNNFRNYGIHKRSTHSSTKER